MLSKMSEDEETGLNGEQCEEKYTCDQFIRFVKNLSETSVLYYCPYQEVLKDYYEEYLIENNQKTMSERIVNNFITTLRNRNKEILGIEVNFYQKELKQKLCSGIVSASRKQFMKIIRKYENEEKIISDILFEKIKVLEFVSCQRVMNFLDDIKKQIEEVTQASLSPEKLKEMSISQRDSEEFINNEEEFNWITDIKLKHRKYFERWSRQMLYFSQYIGDEGVRDQANVFIQNIKKVEIQLIDEIQSLYDHGDKLEKQCAQFEQVYRQMVEKNALDEQTLQNYTHLLDEQKSQLRYLQQEKIQYLQKSQTLDEALRVTRGQLIQIQNQYELIEQQYRITQKKYLQIQSINEKLIQSLNVEEKVAQKKEKQVIFKERSIKQQLDDTLHKFNRLLKERQAQKQTFKKNEDQKTNKIQILQLKIQQLEEQLKNKHQNLNNYVTNSKILNFQAFRNSAIRPSCINNRSSILDIRESYMIKSKLRPKKSDKPEKSEKSEQQNEQIPESPPLQTRLSKKMESQLQNRPTNFSEINKVDIGGVQLAKIQEEENISSVIDVNILPEGEELTKVIKSDDSSVGLEDTNKGFEKKRQNSKVEKAESSLVSKLTSSVIIQKFIGKGVFINVHGVKFEVTILLNHKRFCYFDTKLRLVRYLPIQNIKSFVFCRQNPTMFIIRPKNREQLESKKHIINPMIISIRTREKLIHYLTNNIKKLVKDNRIQLSTRNQVDIFLKVDDQEINMKHKISNMNNPFRLALSHEPVFYAKLQEEGILSMKHNAVLIIQPVGLLCFTGEQTYQLQSKRELLYLLPFEECNISERQNSQQAPGRKVKLIYQNETFEKYFNIIFNNPEDLKRFITSCQQQIEKTKKFKMQISQALDNKFKK